MTFSRKKINIVSAIAIASTALITPNIAHSQSAEPTKTIVNTADNQVSMEQWEQLAQVSSDNNWKFNSNGLYGGLAITEQTWKDYDGEDFAPTADKASKEEQIEIAEKIYAQQGFTPWDGARLLGWLTTPQTTNTQPSTTNTTTQSNYNTTNNQNYTQTQDYTTNNTYNNVANNYDNTATQNNYDNTATQQYSAPQAPQPAPQQPAQASTAGSGVWDQLAQCESGGNWSINTGNGFSGGLQFAPSTWAAYGGQGDASTASREQQIAVAEKVQAAQGWGAWPACSASLGLS